MRIRDPKTTALIFASGKMVVTGAKSEDDSRLASRKYARIVQKLGFDAKFSEFKIQNIVGSCDVKFPIRLEGLAYSHGQFSSYEPEVCRADFLCCRVGADASFFVAPAVPWSYLPHDQAQGRAVDIRVGQDRAHRCKGNSISPFFSYVVVSLACRRSERLRRDDTQTYTIVAWRPWMSCAMLSCSGPAV